MSISLREVSKELDIEREMLSRWIRTGKCPFGDYVPPENDGRVGAYIINKNRLEIYMSGKDMFSCPYAGKGAAHER